MFDILPGMLLYKSFRRFGYPKMMPMNMVFVITHRCNSRCKTCNIWKVKDFSKELQLWEYEKIFHTIDKAVWITLSGGEPFLRKDFKDIVERLCEICSPRIINIPTNGSLYRIIPKVIKKIINSSNGTKIILNISLDDISRKHDKIRGFPGNFDSIMRTINKLKKINSDNFTLGIHSVISKFNVESFYELYNFIEEKIQPDSYIIETAQNRREYFNLNSNLLPSREKMIKTLEFFIKKLEQKELSGIPKLIKSFRLVYYNHVLNIFNGVNNTIPCYAGWISCQINPYGDVLVCGMKNYRIGNLRKNNYDFRKLWFDKKAYKARQKLKQKKCFCLLSNVAYTNIMCGLSSSIKVLLNYLS
jgi:MoaA/NifB/PqqE/SkfB family radical SAM enzyme